MNESIDKPLYNQSGFFMVFLMMILISITAIMIAVAGYLYFYGDDFVKTDMFKKVEEQVTKTKNKEDRLQVPAEIVITKDGFMPSVLSITIGQPVTFVNADNNAHRVIPYPLATRSLLPNLDSEIMQPSDSYTYSFETRGTFTISENITPGKYKALLIVD